MPAKAGTQGRAGAAFAAALDPRFRGGDGKRGVGNHLWFTPPDFCFCGTNAERILEFGRLDENAME